MIKGPVANKHNLKHIHIEYVISLCFKNTFLEEKLYVKLNA